MNKLILSTCLLFSAQAFSQATFFYDNFENGSSNWTITQVDGNNEWVINDVYTGNGGTIPDIPEQNWWVVDAPYSNYLHIVDALSCNNGGSCNANYDPSSASEGYIEMVNNISTLGLNDVTVMFDYICLGEAGVSYGNVEYTTDNGANWNTVNPNFDLQGVSEWTQGMVMDLGINNQPSIRFRIHWRNDDAGGGANPGLGIDEFTVAGNNPWGEDSIVVLTDLDGLELCAGASHPITFTANGAYNSNNIFTVQLSNPNGVFFIPTEVGTFAGGNGTHTMTMDIPFDIAAGTGYRIRIASSEEWFEGANNGVNFTIHPAPVTDISVSPSDSTICEGGTAVLTANGATGATVWWTPSETLSYDDVPLVEATPETTTTYMVSGTTAEGCSSESSITITVEDCAGIEENSAMLLNVYPNPASELLYLQYDPTLDIKLVEILNQTGSVIAAYPNGKDAINITALTAGSYFVRMTTQTGNNTTTRFIK